MRAEFLNPLYDGEVNRQPMIDLFGKFKEKEFINQVLKELEGINYSVCGDTEEEGNEGEYNYYEHTAYGNNNETIEEMKEDYRCAKERARNK